MDPIAYFTAILALLTAIIAFLTSRTVQAQKKAIYAQIILELRKDFGSEKTGDSIRTIIEWKNRKGDFFVQWFGNELASIRRGVYSENIEYFEQDRTGIDIVPVLKNLDAARRHCIQYFKKIAILIETNVVPENIIKKAVHASQVDFLFDILILMEEAINDDFDQREFDVFRRLYPQKGQF